MSTKEQIGCNNIQYVYRTYTVLHSRVFIIICLSTDILYIIDDTII